MTNMGLYKDIATRTGGNIYIGVVGPVRTGKSTFIKKFMEELVLPNIEGDYQRTRATDELPQSAAGKTIMTTEPKFIPEEAVSITVGNNVNMNVRMIDCVGYIVPSAMGYIENEQPRMVMTPWFDEEIPFNMAAEFGTRKVINEHSTIGLVITTDGSITDISREEYAEVEARVIGELKEINKPFAILLNCSDPMSDMARGIKNELEKRYNVPVVALNCLNLGQQDIVDLLSKVLSEFPVKEISVDMPKWIIGLDKEHWLKKALFTSIVSTASEIKKIGEVGGAVKSLTNCEHIETSTVQWIDLGTGSARIQITVPNKLLYKVLGEVTGLEIEDESALMPCMLELSQMKKKYEKIRSALEQVEATGYGIVMPTIDELSLEEPEMLKQGGKYGVKLRAQAPSIHMLRADIMTEVSPIVGSEKQSEELVMYLLKEFEENPKEIWNSNIFGKSLHELVNEGLHNKLYRMPPDARLKLRETVERVINEGCNGLICIII